MLSDYWINLGDNPSLWINGEISGKVARAWIDRINQERVLNFGSKSIFVLRSYLFWSHLGIIEVRSILLDQTDVLIKSKIILH